ncbi:hypothetical protein ACU4GI_32935 [Cupriavidus basilensis]
MSKALGTDDSVNACMCCGKANLKFTVIIELDNGEIVHYGQVCARRNTGKTQRAITSEINAAKAAAVRSAQADYLASPEYLAERARFAEREALARKTGTDLIGRAAAEFVREACEAAMAVRKAIADKYRVSPWSFPA